MSSWSSSSDYDRYSYAEESSDEGEDDLEEYYHYEEYNTRKGPVRITVRDEQEEDMYPDWGSSMVRNPLIIHYNIDSTKHFLLGTS